MTGADTLARATAMHDRGQHREAEQLLSSHRPKDNNELFATYRLLASIKAALGENAAEIDLLQRALALKRDTPALWGRLGDLYTSKGDLSNALSAYRQALSANADDPRIYQGLFSTLMALRHLDEARAISQQLQQRHPDKSLGYLIEGHLEKALGHKREALDAYARAIESQPDCGEALYGLVDLAMPDVDNRTRSHLAGLVRNGALSVADKINVDFAYARILDGESNYTEAFEYYRQANELAQADLAAQGITYDTARTESRFSNTIAGFPAESVNKTLSPLPIDLVPVFVIGMPRSGTTLVEQILASHPDVEAGGELGIGPLCAMTFREARRRSGPIDVSDPEEQALLEEARERYVDELFLRGLEGPMIVDKLPANFEIAGFLRILFPNAPIIHTMRDARATCLSLYTANFSAHEPYYHSLEHLAHYYHQYQRLMKHWGSVLPMPFAEVEYEKLVADPEVQIPALLQATGLEPHEDCMRFYETQRPVMTASHAQVRQPMYTRAVDYWRNYEAWLGPVLSL